MALSLSMGSLRIAHWQATPGAASLRASAPRAATARVSLSVQAEISSRERRIRRHQSLRKKVNGSEERPRLAVFRSNQHIYAQVIDDVKRVTLVGLGTVSEEVKKALAAPEKKSATKNKEAATVVGRMIAEKCKAKGIESVVFDRGGFKYHGRVMALADAAREAGLNF